MMPNHPSLHLRKAHFISISFYRDCLRYTGSNFFKFDCPSFPWYETFTDENFLTMWTSLVVACFIIWVWPSAIYSTIRRWGTFTFSCSCLNSISTRNAATPPWGPSAPTSICRRILAGVIWELFLSLSLFLWWVLLVNGESDSKLLHSFLMRKHLSKFTKR